MNKSIIYLIFITVFVVGCAEEKIRYVKNDANNTQTAVMEHSFEANPNPVKATFTREFSETAVNPVIIELRIGKPADSPALSTDAVIKIDDALDRITLKIISGPEGPSADSLAMNVDDQVKPDVESVQAAAGLQKEYVAKIVLPTSIEKKILVSKSVTFRLYFGSNYSTLNLDAEKLEGVKEFFRSRPAPPK